jgi:exodeoxyribonuclease-3
MVRVITFNANGIRSAARKGFFDWLKLQNADVVCLQEIRAHEEQLNDSCYYPEGYHCYYRSATKKGYAGTALYTREKPLSVNTEIGWDPLDEEGRWIHAKFANISIASMYFPSGSSGEHRQSLKFQAMDKFTHELKKLIDSEKHMMICADWNICHKEIDLTNWRANQKNSGFLPVEREWLSMVYDEIGWIDGFRVINQQPHQYTWWSNRGQARANNVGWRLDYPMITPAMRDLVKEAKIDTDMRLSDHAPLIMDYDISLN